ncbi:MAG: plsY [Clostridiales bacterium]|jgi:glycerol-3-phosphate acyltransferase PlsY|nr:plsY [Clostridiales bacterium]
MELLYRVLAALIGYAFGCLQTSYIIGKLFYKIDIRQHGSGNAGATNAVRVMGKKFGAITFVCDILKGLFAVLLCALIFSKLDTGISLDTLKIYTAIGAMAGHTYPFFLKFKGGKGVSTMGGSMWGFNAAIGWSGAAIFFLLIFLTKYVSVGSIALAIFYGITISIFYSNNLEVCIIAALIAILVIYNHRANIVRLYRGKENKFSLSKK